MTPVRPSQNFAGRGIPIACLFLSGAAGLLYEVCWIRLASLAFGSTVYAASAVLAIFFLGLALGSQWFGQLSPRVLQPLRTYARVEWALGALALASLPAFGLAERLYGVAFRSLGDSSGLLWIVHVALLTLVLLPPTILMGASLPLFCRQYVERSGGIARSVGVLYGLNTLGGALGCGLAGFVLLPAWGIERTVALGAALNFVAGFAVLALRPAAVTPADEPKPARAGESATRRGRLRILALVFGAGLAALGQEVLWTRFLSLVIRNSVYTYTLMLTVILAGIVLGSLIASRFFDRALPRAAIFGTLQVCIALVVLGLMMQPPAFWAGIGHEYSVCFALLLGPAVLSGAAFPLAVRMVVDEPALAGLGVGRIAAVNTLGGIVGALATGFLLLPWVGLQWSTILLTAVNLATGIAAWIMLEPSGSRVLRAVAIAASLLAWVGIPRLTGTRIPNDFLANGGELLGVSEGLQSNLAVVRREGALTLEIDRWWQGQDRKTHQIVAAHLPMLLHAHPRRVLVVGVGAGQTPGRFLLYEIEHLDCVDIEPSVFPLIRSHFEHQWMSDPRVHLIEADGRSFVSHTDDRYDVISLEIGQIFRPGVASFYTRDFYRRARARLAPGGLLSQFVPLPFLPGESFQSMIRTFLEVFPNSVLWYNTSELLLIGVNGDRLTMERSRLELMTSDPRIHRDLEFDYWGGIRYPLNRPEVLLGGFLCGSRGLQALAARAPVDRDDRPALEYAAARVKESASHELPSLAELRRHLDPVETILGLEAPLDSAAAIGAIREKNLGDIEASAYLRGVEGFRRAGNYEGMLDVVSAALRANPENEEAHRVMGDALVLLSRFDEAEVQHRKALDLWPDDALAQRGLGLALHRQGKTAEAIPHYRSALDLGGDDADTRNNLGAALAEQGDLSRALLEFEHAQRLRPGDPTTLRNLDRLHVAQREHPGAPAKPSP